MNFTNMALSTAGAFAGALFAGNSPMLMWIASVAGDTMTKVALCSPPVVGLVMGYMGYSPLYAVVAGFGISLGYIQYKGTSFGSSLMAQF